MNGNNAEQHRTILRHLNMQPYDRVKANRELQEIIESAEEEGTRRTTYNLIERVIDDVRHNPEELVYERTINMLLGLYFKEPYGEQPSEVEAELYRQMGILQNIDHDWATRLNVFAAREYKHMLDMKKEEEDGRTE